VRIYLPGEDHVLAILRRELVNIHLADTSGKGSTRLRMAMMGGHPYRLTSYFYLRGQKVAGEMMQVITDAPDQCIMDSGAYSLMFGTGKDSIPKTYEAYLDYTRRYLDDLASWDYQGIVVEMDAQRIIGVDAVLRLREEFKPLGDRVMYVWHEPEGIDGLMKLARERSFIALGLPELRHIAETKGKKLRNRKHGLAKVMAFNLLRRVHQECGDRPPRIHLLGCTVEDLMETQLAWSCDSTSWLSGIRFGQAYIFTDNLEQCSVRSPRFIAYRNEAVKAFPDVTAYAAQQKSPDYYLNCFTCAHAWAQYQRVLDSRYEHLPMRGAGLPGGPL